MSQKAVRVMVITVRSGDDCDGDCDGDSYDYQFSVLFTLWILVIVIDGMILMLVFLVKLWTWDDALWCTWALTLRFPDLSQSALSARFHQSKSWAPKRNQRCSTQFPWHMRSLTIPIDSRIWKLLLMTCQWSTWSIIWSLQTSDCIKPGEHVNAIGETSCAKLRREDDGEQGLSSGSWRDPMFQSGVACENCLNAHEVFGSTWINYFTNLDFSETQGFPM